MKIFNNIKSWFLGCSKPQQNLTNKIVVSVSDGKASIDIQIEDMSDKGCSDFASMLFLLNDGAYVQTILDILLKLDSIEANHYYISNIIKVWSSLVSEAMINEDTTTGTNKPLISPTEFCKISTNK